MSHTPPTATVIPPVEAIRQELAQATAHTDALRRILRAALKRERELAKVQADQPAGGPSDAT